MKKQHDIEENIFGFVDISHRRYKLRRDVEQTPVGTVDYYSRLDYCRLDCDDYYLTLSNHN